MTDRYTGMVSSQNATTDRQYPADQRIWLKRIIRRVSISLSAFEVTLSDDSVHFSLVWYYHMAVVQLDHTPSGLVDRFSFIQIAYTE